MTSFIVTHPILTILFLSCISSNIYAQKEEAFEITAKAEPLTEINEYKKEASILAADNALYEEQLKKELSELSSRVRKLKLEKEAISEELALKEIQIKKSNQEDELTFANELKELTRLSSIAKAKADKALHELKLNQTEWNMQTAKLEAEIKALETEKKRDAYANAKPIYLANPLQDDGTLIISDRRIEMNGPLTYDTADYITARINYFNNKENNNPIFIVIDASPGGSVMAGYRILKAMEGSQAPVYVVVKSFAASMAASICTLAERSFAYPNAIILHHQISTTITYTNLNLTEQKEFYEESQEWWRRLAKPISAKMGINTDEFI